MKNPLRAALSRGPAAGVLISMPSAHVAQTLSRTGLDWIFIDTEHGPISIESVYQMINATAGTRCAPLVRVAWNEHWLVKPALDAGAMGIIFPMIRSAEDARAAVSSVRYPPHGERGFGPFYAHQRFETTMQDYPDIADKEIVSVLLIEHRDAVDDIENIVAIPGVDICLIAPFDLALSYGIRDSVDRREIKDAIAKVEKAVLGTSVVLGGLGRTKAERDQLIERGYRLILCGFDVALLGDAARSIVSSLNR